MLRLPRVGSGGYHARVRVLAIDFGLRRVGLAISDASATLARPLEVIEAGAADRAERVVAAVERLAREDEGLATIVVGMPRRLDGTPNEQTAAVEAFVEELRGRISQPIVLQDERLSSVEAESRLALRDRDWRRRKKTLDAAAAAVFLQDYLDDRARRRGPAATCADDDRHSDT
jgi:putative Holliday junction resolvase